LAYHGQLSIECLPYYRRQAGSKRTVLGGIESHRATNRHGEALTTGVAMLLIRHQIE
jgi:hypothetical protein